MGTLSVCFSDTCDWDLLGESAGRNESGTLVLLARRSQRWGLRYAKRVGGEPVKCGFPETWWGFPSTVRLYSCKWGISTHSKSCTYEPSGCELLKMWMYIFIPNHIRHEWNWSLPSISYCWWPFISTISHLLSFLWSVTLLACSLNASSCVPAVVPYFSRYCKIKNVFFILSVFLCIICMKSIISL